MALPGPQAVLHSSEPPSSLLTASTREGQSTCPAQRTWRLHQNSPKASTAQPKPQNRGFWQRRNTGFKSALSAVAPAVWGQDCMVPTLTLIPHGAGRTGPAVHSQTPGLGVSAPPPPQTTFLPGVSRYPQIARLAVKGQLSLHKTPAHSDSYTQRQVQNGDRGHRMEAIRTSHQCPIPARLPLQ